jgi:hypothetical protein
MLVDDLALAVDLLMGLRLLSARLLTGVVDCRGLISVLRVVLVVWLHSASNEDILILINFSLKKREFYLWCCLIKLRL